ncbi:DJ-1/PfpI family protein [Roseovarius aquimarinus]|uniref:DJ-1/PfpI family protein n=1 Tax=Roseovarius aquimarinus TaxID=1229156 RepID=A0ABW7IAV2_9RHOB
MITRRFFNLAAILAPFGIAQTARADDQGAARTGANGHDMSHTPPEWQGSEQVVFLAYPGMTALDLVGPQYMFASMMGASVRIAAKTLDPVVTDTGITILPDIVLADAPEAPDVLCVPGAGSGILDVLEDAETIDWLARTGEKARYVTSVCTGTLLLGKAGLIDGYKVTSHWITRPLVEEFGAIPVDARVVRDRNRVTGGGVTAGIDFGLTLLAEMRGEDYAKAVQLLAEYDPAPPFDAGTPDKAGAHLTQMLETMFTGFKTRFAQIVSKG